MSPRRWIVRLLLILAACGCFVAGCGKAPAPPQEARETAKPPDPPQPVPLEAPEPIPPVPPEAPEPVPPESGEPEWPPAVAFGVRQMGPEVLSDPVATEPLSPGSLNPLRLAPDVIVRAPEPQLALPRIMAAVPPEAAIEPAAEGTAAEGPAAIAPGPVRTLDAGTPNASPPPIYDPPLVMRQPEPFGVVARGGEPLEVTTPILAPEEPAAPDAVVPDAAPAAPVSSTAPAPPLAEPSSPAVAREEGDYAVVQVFYGTDRAVVESPDDRPLFAGWLMWTAGCAGVTLILSAFALRRSAGRTTRGLAALGAAATVVLGLLTGYAALYDVIPGWKTEKPRLAYGMERGRGVELGTCEVSIPKEHETGVLESPSIFKLELRESPERHVVLLDVERLPEETFYTALSERIARSPAKDAFVFVHGYNVSFEDAARRTAQIAYDLDFPGAPIFYSWPSQASLTGYTVDETNVEWTVPHLRDFLAELAQRSGAEQVHLVAHSMGNRALAAALRGLSYRRDLKQPMFNHVVLTAPDIDADVFRRDLAPRIVKTAERVTLYASSNDKALSYSKTVHGYPRAGDTGEYLVVVPGIDTIDVSAVDASLFGLGHLYYGSNRTVLADLFDLIRKAKPPEERRWLRPELLGSLRYWVFERIEAARAGGAVPR